MEKIIPKILPMSPYEVYLQRVVTTYEGIRKRREGLAYTPAQFGGLFDQETVANAGAVLEITEFEIK
jgi:xanthine dehydrogenase molybdopterin-binding subunit B